MQKDQKRPLIGLVPLVDLQRASYWMLPGYMQGVEQAGGVPLMLPLTEDEEELDRLAGLCDGFLLTGGQDVGPDVYGAPHSALCGELCPARDAMERRLLALARAQDKPVLGICRGIQFLNAALGGTLWQDLPGQCPSPVDHHQTGAYEKPIHTVRLLPDTPLANLLQREVLPVNSYHHQAVRALAPGLAPMAVAPDGIVEAVYEPGRRFVWAVQWHPEFSWKADEASRRIFAAFVGAC